jgi:hypothetical protein
MIDVKAMAVTITVIFRPILMLNSIVIGTGAVGTTENLTPIENMEGRPGLKLPIITGRILSIFII